MTPNVSAEGSWKDFFPRRTQVGDNDKHGSDFGIVLQDFLQKVSQILVPLFLYLFTVVDRQISISANQ
jgi:predicted YcjX-like family ATPase